MKKIQGILGILIVVFVLTAIMSEHFLLPGNLENLLHRTGLFGIISVGVAFVIITKGIDLSIGSVICLVGCGLPWLLLEQGWSVTAALLAVLVFALSIGLTHGLLITKLKLQPFVVTLCGLLIYRGITRGFTDDQSQGFKDGYKGLRKLATSEIPIMEISLPMPFVVILFIAALAGIFTFKRRFRNYFIATLLILGNVLFFGFKYLLAPIFEKDQEFALGTFFQDLLMAKCYLLPRDVDLPMPMVILLIVSLIAGIFLNKTIYGRYLLALGNNEEAAKFSGINVDNMVILAYMICAFCSGLGGLLFVFDVNSAQPSNFGNFYELYAIAAAVLGGCSLRGGTGTIVGVVIGTALMQVLRNMIVLVDWIPQKIEFAIIGAVILVGVIADEVIKRAVAQRRQAKSAA